MWVLGDVLRHTKIFYKFESCCRITCIIYWDAKTAMGIQWISHYLILTENLNKTYHKERY